jgi:hypothetical protein
VLSSIDQGSGKRGAWVDRSVADPKGAMLVLFAGHSEILSISIGSSSGARTQLATFIDLKSPQIEINGPNVRNVRNRLPGLCMYLD